MAKRTKYLKPERRRIVTAEVLASKPISPNFVRVTVGGSGLDEFAPMGFDQWFRLFLPRDGELRLPTAANSLWYAQWLRMSREHRPVVRNYTVRAFRAAGTGRLGATAELDIDFALHGEQTPACHWATTTSVGTAVGLLDEGITYQPPGHRAWSLLVGDESALPAIAGVLGSSPRDQRGAAYLEIAHPEDAQDLGEPEGVQVNWLVRRHSADEVGSLALAAIADAELPAAGLYAFIVGEQKLAAGIRRHLVNDRGVAKSDITFTGYWRFGKASPG